MSLTSSNNFRIIKNTIALSFRLLMTMAVSIYTSRVILENLGVIDFGIYNVVGGIVGMFSFLSNSMLDATQRYLNFHLGKMDYDQINRVFSTSVNIFFLIGIIVILLSEIIGFYLLKTKLNIPDERYSTAIIVFQLSLFASFITISSTPYNALIISHEKMTAFAFVSIVQSILTLVTAISLMYVKSDKLILYALMIACIHVGVRLFYSLYCKAKFKEIRYKFYMDISMFKEMFSFSIWTLTSTFAHMTYTQGITLLVNVFFGPAVNAAQSLANQVNSALLQFANTFTLASKPQITKYYALNEKKKMHDLVFISTKVSFVIMLMLGLPFFIRTDYILELWLKNPPEYTNLFLRFLLCVALVSTLASPVITAIQATGRIKGFQIGVTISNLMILPTSYFAFKLGGSPIWAYVCMLFFLICTQVVRVYFYSKQLGFSKYDYLVNLLLKLLVLLFGSTIIAYLLNMVLPGSFIGFILLFFLIIIVVAVLSVTIVLDTNERSVLFSKIKEYFFIIRRPF